MKANRKFVEGEQAVSAVIGVILMVAITVAIAATVYVYVSGMLGGNPTTQEDAVVTSSVSGDTIRLLLTKSGQMYDDGYADFAVFVNGTVLPATSVVGDAYPDPWVVGASIVIEEDAAGDAITGGVTYSVSVTILDTVVFDSNVKIP